MSEVNGLISDFLGGLCTLPPINRNRNEVSDARNVLFSTARGCYRRPGTIQVVQLGQWVSSPFADRAIWTFPISADVFQVVMVRSGHCEIFWADQRTKDFYRNTRGEYVCPEDLERPLPRPVIVSRSAYLNLRSGQKAAESFRVIRAQGKVYVLNRNATVELTSRTTRDNSAYRHYYMIYFVAVTSGLEASLTVKWENSGAQSQRVVLGESAGVESAGEKFAAEWTETTSLAVTGRGNMAILYNADPDRITDIEITSENIATVVITEESDDLKSVPSFQALPPYAPRDWIVQVSGSAETRLDDTWLRFTPGGER